MIEQCLSANKIYFPLVVVVIEHIRALWDEIKVAFVVENIALAEVNDICCAILQSHQDLFSLGNSATFPLEYEVTPEVNRFVQRYRNQVVSVTACLDLFLDGR